ncbi:mutator type transposase [Tanacetum coccineum]
MGHGNDSDEEEDNIDSDIGQGSEEDNIDSDEDDSDEEDSDYIDDEDHVMNEVEVDMKKYLENIDKDVNDASDSKNDGKGKKALRKLRIEHEENRSVDTYFSESFYVGRQFTDKKASKKWHRFCLRHIHENMKLRGQLYKELLWKSATSTTVSYFDKAMDELKRLNKKAYDYLRKIPPQHWSRAHFSGMPHCDVLLNNICEVFNRQLLDGRDVPILTCLEFVRGYLIKRIVNVQKVTEKSNGPLTPAATALLNHIEIKAKSCRVTWKGGHKYGVVGPYGDQMVVDVHERICSCRKWELTGMPCKHALASIWNMTTNNMDVGTPKSWVHPAYWLVTWKKVYSFKINPHNGKHLGHVW